jgi:hypothetical protein
MLQNTTPLVVTLEAQEWNQILFMLDEIPMAKRLTVPLAAKVSQQLKQQEEEHGGGEATMQIKPNGGVPREAH